jgi:hypothetical protein
VVNRNNRSQLESKVAFLSILGKTLDRLNNILVNLLDGLQVVRLETLDYIVSNPVNFFLVKTFDIVEESIDCGARSEDRANGPVDHEVGELDPEQLVGSSHAEHGVVDKHVAAHNLVDQVLLDEQRSRVGVEW